MKDEDFEIGRIVWHKGHNEFMKVVKAPYYLNNIGSVVDVEDDNGKVFPLVPTMAFSEFLEIPEKYKELVKFTKPKKFYFTFGFGQPNEGCYVEIVANSYNEARAEMISRYGTKWAFQYDESEWNNRKDITQAELYNLKKVD